MKSFTHSLVISSICVVMAGCGSQSSGPQSHLSAPASEKQASERFIVEGSAEDVKAVKEVSPAFRVLSAKHNIIEVSGLTYSEIKAISPSVSATQNQYVEVLNKRSDFMKLLKSDDPQPQEQLPESLKGCDLESPTPPEAQLELLENVFVSETSPTMELGKTIKLSGAQSQSSVQGGEVEVRWEVLNFPAASKLEPELTKGEEFSMTPDALGFYRVAMVVEDETKGCGAQVAAFMVTANPEIEFAKAGEEMPTLDLKAFSHLPRVEAQQSWKASTGKGLTIAVLDTGLHFNHRAIKFNLAINEAERNGTPGVNDDGNDKIDDVLGWDFVNDDNNPFDDEGHGSHVSGLAASHIFGLAKDAKILPIKVLNAAGGGDIGSIIAGVRYAADNGADVINTSLQRLEGDIPGLKAAFDYAHSKGVVIVASSGNDTLDLSLPENQIYPGEMDSPNVVNVAAIGENNGLASYSNFGKVETDVAAPGGDGQTPLYSLAPLNPREIAFIGSGGTSMAAPIVAGIVAQMLEVNDQLTPQEVREILMKSGTSHAELKDVVGSGKMVSAVDAIEMAESMLVTKPLF